MHTNVPNVSATPRIIADELLILERQAQNLGLNFLAHLIGVASEAASDEAYLAASSTPGTSSQPHHH